MEETRSLGRSSTVGVMEENILAILDAAEAKDTPEANDDRLSFLEAVRAASIFSDSSIPPTCKLLEAVFQILSAGKSLESIMESFRLLNELDKSYPRVHVSTEDSSVLVVVEEAWSPFCFGLDAARGDKAASEEFHCGAIDSSGFHLLIQDLVEVANEKSFHSLELKAIRSMLLFQFIVNALERDFVPCENVYKDTKNWNILRESLLSILLGSRRINFKNMMRDCLFIMCSLFGICNSFIVSENPEASADGALAIAVHEAGKSTCIAMRRLLTMIMELDLSKKKAEIQGVTTRADGVRTPLVEIILDELTYSQDMFPQFLQVFAEPKWKLEIILQYFSKYTAKPSIRTRRSNGNDSTDDPTLNGVLKYLKDLTAAKNIIKKIGTEVVQLLLAHAFKAHLSIPCPNNLNDMVVDSAGEEVRSTSLVDLCTDLISAFSTLGKADGKMELIPFGKEALFTAVAIRSTKGPKEASVGL